VQRFNAALLGGLTFGEQRLDLHLMPRHPPTEAQ
jgi:hypothetical protein